MAEWSRSSINVSSDDVASQRSFYMGSDDAHSSINKGSDETLFGSSFFKGSDETYDICCVPCQEIEKKFLPADGYCINCEEHLCFDCYSNHGKYKASRQHKLQDKHTMPQSKPVAMSSTKIDKHHPLQSKPVSTSSTKIDKHRAPQSKPGTTKSLSKTAILSMRTVAKDSAQREINIRSSADRTSCTITGMAILPDSQLVITDFRNKKVKLIDTRYCKIVSELSLNSPVDITSVQEGRLAVTLPFDNKIQFLTISSNKLYTDSDVSVNGECKGIIYYNYEDKSLIVTFTRPGKVEIISLSGEVIRSIEMNNTGARIFQCPEYVALTNDNKGMYVSDRENGSVTFITLDGNIKSVYKDETLTFPKGLCVDKDGRVFVACGSGTVYQLVPGTDNQLVPGTDKLQPLLDKIHGVSHMPYSLAYCDWDDTLYVGMRLCDVLKVFRLQ